MQKSFSRHPQLGIANRNPLNFRTDNGFHWKGLDAVRPSEGGLLRFHNAVYCYRAAILLFRRRIERGFNTPRRLITLWLPGHGGIKEQHYLPCVCGRSRLAADKVLSPQGMDLPRLIAAMARQETGTHIVPESIYELRLRFGV